MSKFSIFTLALLFNFNTSATESSETNQRPNLFCQGIYKEGVFPNIVVNELIELEVIMNTNNSLLVESKHRGYAYNASYNRKTGTLLMTLSTGPNFTEGTVSSGTINDQGFARLSVVNYDKVYQVECIDTDTFNPL